MPGCLRRSVAYNRATESSDKIALKRWENFLSDHLKDPAVVKMHMDRRGVEVFPITIEEHIKQDSGPLMYCGHPICRQVSGQLNKALNLNVKLR